MYQVSCNIWQLGSHRCTGWQATRLTACLVYKGGAETRTKGAAARTRFAAVPDKVAYTTAREHSVQQKAASHVSQTWCHEKTTRKPAARVNRMWPGCAHKQSLRSAWRDTWLYSRQQSSITDKSDQAEAWMRMDWPAGCTRQLPTPHLTPWLEEGPDDLLVGSSSMLQVKMKLGQLQC